MNWAADLGGIYIVPNVTVQNINMGDLGPWETDWILIT